jgi:hypothetical protein
MAGSRLPRSEADSTAVRRGGLAPGLRSGVGPSGEGSALRPADAGSVSAIALQARLGNDAAQGGAQGGAAELSYGALTLEAAGFGGAGAAVPGQVSLTAMRRILRQTQAEREGLDTGTAAAHIGARTGAPLPEAIRARLESAFGHDFSHVRIHTDGAAAEAAEALHALAFTIGRDIYFGRGQWNPAAGAGLELLAHELTHVVQSDEGRLPGPRGPGMDVSRPTDPHEREAYAMGRQVANTLGPGVSRPLAAAETAGPGPVGAPALADAAPAAVGAPSLGESSPSADSGPVVSAPSAEGAVASRQGRGTSPTRPAASGQGPRPGAGGGQPQQGSTPATTTLVFAGRPIRIQAPPPGQRTSRAPEFTQIQIPGLRIHGAAVEFDESGKVTAGEIGVDVALGPYINATGKAISIGPDGRIDARVMGVEVNIPGVGRGTVDLRVAETGLSGMGTMGTEGMSLAHGLVVAGGELRVRVDEAGAVSGVGDIQGQIPGLGDFSMRALLQDGQIRGVVQAVTAAPLEVVPGFRLETGLAVRGVYSPESCTVQGQGAMTVRDWAKGTVAARLSIGKGWSVLGRVQQLAPRAFGSLTVDTSNLAVRVTDGVLGAATLSGQGRVGPFGLTIAGSYDAAADAINGQASATLLEPQPIGATGSRLLTLTGVATIEGNLVRSIRGTASAELSLDGAPTFHVEASAAVYEPEVSRFDGAGRVTTLRPLTFGAAGGVQAEIPTGATGSVTVENGAVRSLAGGLSYRIFDPAGPIGSGTIELAVDEAGLASGEGVFTLDAHYGFPDRFNTTCYLKKGSTAIGVLTQSELKEVRLRSTYAVVQPPDGVGKVEVLLSGKLDVAGGKVDGTGRGRVTEDWPLPVGLGSFTLQKGGTVEAKVESGLLDRLRGTVPFAADFPGAVPIQLHGQITGDWSRETGDANGQIEATTDSALRFPAAGGTIEVLSGATARGTVTASALETLQLDAALTVEKDGQVYLLGEVAGAVYNVQTGLLSFSADLSLGVRQSLPTPDGLYTLHVEEGSTVGTTVADNVITQLRGSLDVALDDAEGPLLAGNITATEIVPETWAVTGTAEAQTARDFAHPRATNGAIPGVPGTTFTVKEGSEVSGAVTANALQRLSADLLVQVDDAQGPLAEGLLSGTLDLPTESADVLGMASLMRDVPLRAPGGGGGDPARPEGWSATLLKNSSVGVHLTPEGLAKGEIAADARLDRGGQPVAKAALTGQYKLNDEVEGFSGTAQIETTARIPWQQEGRFPADLDVGSTATATMAQSALTQATGNFKLLSQLEGQDTVRVGVDATYTPGAGISGTGQAELLRAVRMGQGGLAAGDEVWLQKGSEAEATVENDQLQRVGGTLKGELRDGQGKYLTARGTGTWTWADGADKVTVKGSLDVTREKEIARAGQWVASLTKKGTSADASVKDNALVEITGTIGARLDRAGEPFAQVAANGRWAPGEGLSGEGAAELLIPELLAADAGRFSLWITQGASATAKVENTQVTELGGQVPLKIKEGGAEFLRGELGGTYRMLERTFTGSGSVEVVNERKLADFAHGSFWLTPGSGANVNIQNNQISHIGGQVNLSARDPAEFLRVRFDGRYDVLGGTGFTGGGAAEVTREKRLFENGSYAFALAPGAGANATVTENALTRVNGNVPFVIYDSPQPLLRGHVNGEWTSETGQISGEGHVELARDLTYGPLKVLAGSGGTGVVQNSQLQRFSGMIRAILSDAAGSPLVRLEANGSFDAVRGVVERLEGQVTMLRDWTPIPGVRIFGVSGTGLVENNELKRVEGQGSVEIPSVHATGRVQAGWRNAGGNDVYWGNGDLAFNWAMGRAGRGITGAGVGFTLEESGAFQVSGDVDYRINRMIAGSLDMTMDQSLDPVLGGSLQATGNLIEGKELFALDKRLVNIGPIRIWGPLALNGGIRAQLSLATLPLTMNSDIAVSGWRPRTAATTVPDFDAEMSLGWGLNLHAGLIPYLELGGDLGVVSAYAGVEGALAVDANPRLSLDVGLHGEGGQYWGDVAVGVKLAPTASLTVTPYVRATLLSKEARANLASWPIQLGQIFNFEWGKSYTFGDRPTAPTSAPVQTLPAPAPRVDRTPREGPAQSGGGNRSGSSRVEGGPSIDGGGLGAASGLGQAQGGQSEIGGLLDKLDKLVKLAEGLGAIGELVDMVGGVVRDLAMGPVGIFSIVWKIFKGELSWDRIKGAVDKVIAAMGIIMEMMANILPDWFQRVRQFIANGPPDILNALWGRDEAAARVVRDGRTIHEAPPEILRELWHMLKGTWLDWTSERDEDCILEILEAANNRGLIRQLVTGAGDANSLLGTLDGHQDRRARQIFYRAGIPFDGDRRTRDFLP